MVLRKGDPGDVFYIIEEGTFSIFDDKKTELARVGKGSCFGELALLKQDVRAANVVAITDAKVLWFAFIHSLTIDFRSVLNTASQCLQLHARHFGPDSAPLEIRGFAARPDTCSIDTGAAILSLLSLRTGSSQCRRRHHQTGDHRRRLFGIPGRLFAFW